MVIDMIPAELHKFFWEYKVAEINDNNKWFFVIERLIEHGDDDAVRWILQYYPQEKIIEVVKNSRQLSRKTANFWKNYFRLKEEEVKCLQKSSPGQGRICWPG